MLVIKQKCCNVFIKGKNMTERIKKEDRRVRRTKKMLTQALTELMQQKQVNEITVKELTDRADMNRGTFYMYYKDIYDMLKTIENNMFNELNEILTRHEQDNVKQKTALLLKDLFSFMKENSGMVQVLLSPNGDINFLHQLNEVLREKCLQYFKTAEQEIGDDTFDYQYSFIVFGTAGLIRSWVSRGYPESAEHMANLADAMIRRGSLN